MSSWRNIELGKAIQFNPPERITKGNIAKKIAMEKLTPFEKKIRGFVLAEYSAGPKFRNGDTLVAKITPCLENGKTAQVDILDDGEVAFGSSEFIVLRSNGNSIQDYIFYLAKSPAFRKKAISCMEGTSGRKRVNEGALKLQVLPIPDVSTQQRIASVLSSLDSKIELNNRINRELEQMAKLLYDYWFVQFEFPVPEPVEVRGYKTCGGKMVWNEELKREIPEGWKVKRLDEIADLKAGGDKPKNYSEIQTDTHQIPIFSNGITNDGLYGFTHEAKILKPSITVSARGTIGYCVMRNKPFVPIIRLIVITPNNSYESKFLYERIKSMVFDNSGSVQQQLTVPQISGVKIVMPASEILKKYETLTSAGMKKIELNKEENQQLASLRDWLLPMLMNGQVTVGAKEKVNYEVTEGMDVAAEPNDNK